jgi:hypothetical protein
MKASRSSSGWCRGKEGKNVRSQFIGQARLAFQTTPQNSQDRLPSQADILSRETKQRVSSSQHRIYHRGQAAIRMLCAALGSKSVIWLA